ncbi:MAG TPA: pseudouridine synthase [Bacteroidota bacterium]|nr:pseudouridine synthase [Bacteroidota bacterium]
METKDSDLHQKAVRLNRFLALAGIGSRRHNDELILSGVVKVNGRPVKALGTKVDPTRDRVTVRGQPVGFAEKSLYILFNKPKDCITTLKDEKGRTTVMDYVRVKERIYPVGRLDRNTTGALLLTNDGELAHALTHPKFEIEKVYRVVLERGILDEHLSALKKGVRLEDGVARVRAVEVIPGEKRRKLLVALHEGRNREVRRIFEALGYEVKQLERIAFAGLTTSGLKRGEWRKLTLKEIDHLRSLSKLKHSENAQ